MIIIIFLFIYKYSFYGLFAHQIIIFLFFAFFPKCLAKPCFGDALATLGDARRRSATLGDAWRRLATLGDAWRRLATLGDAKLKILTYKDIIFPDILIIFFLHTKIFSQPIYIKICTTSQTTAGSKQKN